MGKRERESRAGTRGDGLSGTGGRSACGEGESRGSWAVDAGRAEWGNEMGRGGRMGWVVLGLG